MTLWQLTEKDCRERKPLAINPHDRDTWRSGVRSAMPCKTVTWKGPHCCGCCSCTCTFIKKSGDDDDDDIGCDSMITLP